MRDIDFGRKEPSSGQSPEERRGLVFYKLSVGPRSAVGGYLMLGVLVVGGAALLLGLAGTAWVVVCGRTEPPYEVPSEDLVPTLPAGVSVLGQDASCGRTICSRSVWLRSDIYSPSELTSLAAASFQEAGWPIEEGDTGDAWRSTEFFHDRWNVSMAVDAFEAEASEYPFSKSQPEGLNEGEQYVDIWIYSNHQPSCVD